jgi:hypothetical protein
MYDPFPRYPLSRGSVQLGWDEAVATLPRTPLVLAVDGPEILDWDGLCAGVAAALSGQGFPAAFRDARERLAPWSDVLRATESERLADDPHFAAIPQASLASLVTGPAPTVPDDAWTVVFGPGAGLVDHDVLWYADLPKRFAEAAVGAGRGRNLGQRDGDGPPTSRRLLYVDWPILDRHRDALAGRIDRFIDGQEPGRVTSIDGEALRSSLADLSRLPFRLRPTFNSQPWGGHWAQRELRMGLDAPNTALGYELIAQEGGILLGDGPTSQVEVPFGLLVSLHADEVLGERVAGIFGPSFPIRFDYLDTLGGGDLSVHCHPRPSYMRDTFGFPYPQHETYYLMAASEGSQIFLGLRGGVDLGAFHGEAAAADQRGRDFDVFRYVQSHRAVPHQLFAIPTGTPHGSGAGNVVLEISSSPYLYSLRIFDWLRPDADGSLRPIHVEHAFANLSLERTGGSVARDLIRAPHALRAGPGWHEASLSDVPELFYDVRRVDLEPGATAAMDLDTGFHVLNVVDGDAVEVRANGGVHELRYAETLVMPAGAGAYVLRAVGPSGARVAKALIR